MHILVAEDEVKLAGLIRRVLEQERHVVELAYDGEHALDLGLSGSFDIIILDIMMPRKDGIAVCRALREAGVKTPVLMLTARDAVPDRVRGLDSGADDYLTKPFAFEELLARIRALSRRGDRDFEPADRLQVADLVLDRKTHEVTRGGRTINLTPKEFALLEFLMRNAGQVLNRDRIIEHVWGYESDALGTNVDIYIHFLRRKIDKGFDRALIHSVRGLGYKIQG